MCGIVGYVGDEQGGTDFADRPFQAGIQRL